MRLLYIHYREIIQQYLVLTHSVIKTHSWDSELEALFPVQAETTCATLGYSLNP